MNKKYKHKLTDNDYLVKKHVLKTTLEHHVLYIQLNMKRCQVQVFLSLIYIVSLYIKALGMVNK